MPDFERMTDQLRIDLSTSETAKEWARGYVAGKNRARYEVIAIVVVMYFVVVLIGKFSGA